ncbi:hypothetical protein LOK49_LG07G00485 [Camellia lanceoleosa]|uniref:Uncharacterized protein n=1 Tax=Camellia lanceoleosa TaxID=1840588 RepID=A0ACC0GYQ5_9ERIC|nr:hypothetical protein LOK49_LG07G00485 [Camellia lanceoleosa]
MASSSSTLPWLWVIEALASFKEVDASILIEFFFAQQTGSTKGVSSAPDSKIEFDSSYRCEDVVRQILHEISASNLKMDGPEMLKWDVQNFIKHKRVCFPKSTLQQLKDAILEGNHRILASLKEKSGLSIGNQSENRITVDDDDLNAVPGRLEKSSDSATMEAGGNLTAPTAENLDGLLREDSPNRDLLPSKRDRSDLDTENQSAKSNEDLINMDNGCDPRLHNAKKLKRDAACTSGAVGQKSVPIIGNELSEDSSRRDGENTVREGSDLAILSQISCNNDTVPLGTSGDGPDCGLPVNGAEDDGKDSRDKCEKAQLNTSNGVLNDGSFQNNFPDSAKDDMVHNPIQEMSSDSDGFQDEKVDVAMEKRTFLNSQCTFSVDSLATADWTELTLCMKCNEGGQLLVYSSSTCPLVVHQRCLSSAPSFDDSGKFYCPFCAYSHAISKYFEVKKKASLARKDLAAFIGLENGHRANKLCKRFLRPEQNQLRRDDNVNGNNQTNYNGNLVNEVNSSQYRENVEAKQQAEPSVSGFNGNLSCREGGVTVNDGTLAETQQIDERSGSKLHEDNPSCRDAEIVNVTKILAGDGKQQEVLQQPISHSTQKAACPPNADAEESSEEENDKTSSNYSRSLRRKEKKYTYPAIPQLRRKKLPWTAAEEVILKEGVNRFSSVRDRTIPWKRIWEFGVDVFQKGRTSIDLKDKWRNICIGSPKSNPKSK